LACMRNLALVGLQVAVDVHVRLPIYTLCKTACGYGRTYSFDTASPPCRAHCRSAISYVVDECTVGAWCGRALADDGVAAYGNCTGADYSLTDGHVWFVLGERPSEQS
jgi:hypothetical protein